MSKLESKLSASMQAQRRTSADSMHPAATPVAGEHKTEKVGEQKTAKKVISTQDRQTTDLNAGGGRARNPERIWPD